MKKILKAVLFIAAVLAVLGGILYYFNHLKKKNEISADEEEDLFADNDIFDLSSLKFSRHYVDLR